MLCTLIRFTEFAYPNISCVFLMVYSLASSVRAVHLLGFSYNTCLVFRRASQCSEMGRLYHRYGNASSNADCSCTLRAHYCSPQLCVESLYHALELIKLSNGKCSLSENLFALTVFLNIFTSIEVVLSLTVAGTALCFCSYFGIASLAIFWSIP